MKIIQKIRDFFSKHIWKKTCDFIIKDAWKIHACKRLWVRFFSARYGKMAEVNAADLQKICEYVNPSYSGFMDYALFLMTRYIREQEGQHLFNLPMTSEQERNSFIAPGMVYYFYHDSREFLVRLRSMLSDGIEHPNWDRIYYSLRDFHSESCSPNLKGFEEMVRKYGLQGHVIWRGKTIRFKKIKVNGAVKLALGGRFNRWLFNRVQFCDDAAINIYPPREDIGGKMFFSKNVCCGKFACSFSAVSRIHIGGNIFNSSLEVGRDVDIAQNGELFGKWIQHMTGCVRNFSSSIVEFSNNYIEKFATLYNNSPASGSCSIGAALFVEGNYLGGLSVPTSSPAQKKWSVEGNDDIPPEREHVKNMRFDMHEHIKMPPSKEMAMRYKDYFVSLKNKAIKANNREAEFNYGRKERYFDRGVTTSRQDKFILWWSHLVSNSGVSWLRPAAILLVGQWILAAIFIGGFGGCDGWLIATVESLNPLSSLDDIAKSPCCEEWIDSFSASIYNAVRRIFSLALLYEIIKVLRRFSN